LTKSRFHCIHNSVRNHLSLPKLESIAHNQKEVNELKHLATNSQKELAEYHDDNAYGKLLESQGSIQIPRNEETLMNQIFMTGLRNPTKPIKKERNH
jgi:hypothetical protein